MKNNNKKISASEINQFLYCPYQWYYKRYYGSQELLRRYKKAYGDTNPTTSAFEKGVAFHKKYYRHYTIKKVLTRMFILLVVLLMIAGWWFKCQS